MNFCVEPVYLSPEHKRHVEKFTGCPYDPEESARLQAWARFAHWHRKQFSERNDDAAVVRDRVGHENWDGQSPGEAGAVGPERETATVIPLTQRAVGRVR